MIFGIFLAVIKLIRVDEGPFVGQIDKNWWFDGLFAGARKLIGFEDKMTFSLV